MVAFSDPRNRGPASHERPREPPTGLVDGLAGFHDGLMGLHDGLMGLHDGLMGLHDGLMGFVTGLSDERPGQTGFRD